MQRMNFKRRKKKGNIAERRFMEEYPDWKQFDNFDMDDFETTTSDMSDEQKYKPDYISGSVYCEVKNSIFWNQDECDWQRRHYGDNLRIYLKNQLFSLKDISLDGPYPGSPRGSGLPYYRVERK